MKEFIAKETRVLVLLVTLGAILGLLLPYLYLAAPQYSGLFYCIVILAAIGLVINARLNDLGTPAMWMCIAISFTSKTSDVIVNGIKSDNLQPYSHISSIFMVALIVNTLLTFCIKDRVRDYGTIKEV